MARTVADFDLTPQRGENAQINWGGVASDFSKTITDAIARRKARKKAIADQYAKQADKLGEIEESDDPTIQAQLVAASQASMRELSDRYDLVKNGLLSPEEFSLFQTNQKADYKTASIYMKSMGKWAAEIKNRMDNNKATNGDIFVYDFLTKYGGLAGVEITTGKDGRLVYNTLKNVMTMEEAKKALAINRGLPIIIGGSDTPHTDYLEKISDEDAIAYIKANPKYDGTISDDRRTQIGVQDLAKLFTYRGDPGVVVDTVGAIKEQVDVLGTYIRSYFNKTSGQTTTINDFRNAPGTEDTKKGGAYRETLKILQDKLATSPNEIVQVLTNLGGYQIALDAEDARQKYGEDVDLSKIIYADYQNGQVTYSNMDGKKAEADKIIDRELNKQLDSSITQSAPSASWIQYQKDESKKAEDLSKYVNAVEKMLTTDDENEYQTQARLLIQRVNSSGQLGDNKLNRIIRKDGAYVLEFMDGNGNFFEETPISITQGESTLPIHEALFSLITPGDESFELYKGALDNKFGKLAIKGAAYERGRVRPSVIAQNEQIMGTIENPMSTYEYLKDKFGDNVRWIKNDEYKLPGAVDEIFRSLLLDTRVADDIVVEYKDKSRDELILKIGGVDYSDIINDVVDGNLEGPMGGIPTKKLNRQIYKVYKKVIGAGGGGSSTGNEGELDG